MIFIFTVLSLLVGTGIHSAEQPLTPAQAFQRLKDGNQRFVSGKRNCVQNLLKELEAAQEKQEPYAAILCCSDSRIPPEFVFDESLGKLFVIRVAGNVSTDVTIGSIEYAVEHLKVPIVIVLGHDACGVLTAALEGGPNLPPFVNDLVNEVSRPVAQAKKESKGKDFAAELQMAIVKNVQLQMEELLEKSTTLQGAVNKKHALVKGAVFHFENGEVEWCPCSY